MLLVAKHSWTINILTAILGVAAAVHCGEPSVAAPGGDGLRSERNSPEPVVVLQEPQDHCLYDPADAGKPGHATGFEPGLRSGSELLALYVRCTHLNAAREGRMEWLPEWVAVEKNTVTYPSDDDRSLGTHGAVKQLCEDAQSAAWGHRRYENPDFALLVKQASGRLSYQKPEVFLGVIGEEEHACYLASLRIVFSPSGQPQRFLIVTAFMQAGDRWVTQSVRRELATTRGATEDVLAIAKREAKSFFERNH